MYIYTNILIYINIAYCIAHCLMPIAYCLLPKLQSSKSEVPITLDSRIAHRQPKCPSPKAPKPRTFILDSTHCPPPA